MGKILYFVDIQMLRSLGEKVQMWSSRDVALIIITAVLVFVLTVLIFQLATRITGVQGTSFIFTFAFATFISLTFLLFEGRRWRFFCHNALYALLTLPTSTGGIPFDIFPRLVIILAGFPLDLILNSFYNHFKSRDGLMWWSVLTGLATFSIIPLMQILIFPIYFSSGFVTAYTNTVILMSPFLIGGGIVGGYLGYKLYKRVLPHI
jgi:hypothetical protein